MRVPRLLKKDVLRYVFSNGEKPISYLTLYKNYIFPHLEDIGISENKYKSYRKGIPLCISKKIIAIHQIEEEELSYAIESVLNKKKPKFTASY